MLAFKDPTNTSIIEQDLSANNAGLTAGSYGIWTVGFDYGWRTNTAGDDAAFTFSLVNLNDNSVLSSQVLSLATTPAVFDTYTLLGTASLSLSYDNTTAGLEFNNIALRIQRTDDGTLGNGKWQSTAFIDSINVTAVPEPSAALLGGLGLLALLRRRR